ncbi:hypothetical protein [Paraburkholderia sp. SIMBA_030]|uniref:hypothetical protein n=1 Tax=Paraburkholderia sp. SIMBA_030 TaxID=3085773 RepID=UPI0039786052
MKSRTPSDFAIVAIFRDKRKPRNAARSAFPLDFMAIFQRYCNDIAAAPPFFKVTRTDHQPRPMNLARKSAPIYAQAAVLMRQMKPAALVDRFSPRPGVIAKERTNAPATLLTTTLT